MGTIAQFSIRDADAADSQITEVPEHEGRSRGGSVNGRQQLKERRDRATRTTRPLPHRHDQNLRSSTLRILNRRNPHPYPSSTSETPPPPTPATTNSPPTQNSTFPSPDGPTYSKGMLSHNTSPPPDQYHQHHEYSSTDELDDTENSPPPRRPARIRLRGFRPAGPTL